MAKITAKQSIEKNLLFTFFVLFALFITENLIASKFRIKNYVEVTWKENKNYIEIGAIVYDYSYGPSSEHGYLGWCNFEASDNGVDYYKLMDIFTYQQMEADITKFSLVNKLKNAQIEFIDSYYPSAGSICPERRSIIVHLRNSDKLASVSLGWNVSRDFRNVSLIRISGTWKTHYPFPSESFHDVKYRIDKSDQSMLKSDIPGIITKVSKNDTVKVFKDSEAIVVKGADRGANIKVYNPLGAEIKSVISNNDVVKIKVPAKQIYLVHIGKSRYKVAM